MRITDHFWLSEFERSATATRLGIDNRVPPHFLANVQRTAGMLERIREFLGGVPIVITSGYRCPELNAAVKGSATSDHLYGLAADWRADDAGSPSEIAAKLKPHVDELGIGQLINEYPSPDGWQGWVHTGVNMPSRQINRVLTYLSGEPPRVGVYDGNGALLA